MVVLAQMRVLECGLRQEAKLLCSPRCGCYKSERGDVHKVVLMLKRVLKIWDAATASWWAATEP